MQEDEKEDKEKTSLNEDREESGISDYFRSYEEEEDEDFSRRDFLKSMGAGMAGFGAAFMIPGASGLTVKDDNSFKFENLSSEETKFEVGTDGHIDLHGGNVEDANLTESKSIETEELNREGSWRDGSIVRYDPENRGPYADGQEVLNDVPDGGTLIIASGSEWDVAEEGRINLSRGITIRGEGYWRDRGDDNTIKGTKIVNTGEDTVDQPVIEFSTSDPSQSQEGCFIYNLSVLHHGNSPAVRLDGFHHSTINDCIIDMDFKGSKGIEYTQKAYFTRVNGCRVARFTDIGIHIIGNKTGSQHEFRGCHVGSASDNNPDIEGLEGPAALRTERQGTVIEDGEYAANTDGGVAIQFYNVREDATVSGGYVRTFVEFDCDGVVIDGKNEPFQNVYAVNMRASGSILERDLIKFEKANDCYLVDPQIDLPVQAEGKLATWSSETFRCGVIANSQALVMGISAESGARTPGITVRNPTMNNAQIRSTIPEDPNVPVFVPYNETVNSPVWWDGEKWNKPSTTSFDP